MINGNSKSSSSYSDNDNDSDDQRFGSDNDNQKLFGTLGSVILDLKCEMNKMNYILLDYSWILIIPGFSRFLPTLDEIQIPCSCI